MDTILKNYLVDGVPYALYNCKNTSEIKEYILKNSKYQLLPEFLEILAKREIENLVNYKLEKLKIKS